MRDGRRTSKVAFLPSLLGFEGGEDGREGGREGVYVGGAGRREGGKTMRNQEQSIFPLMKRERRRYDDQPLVVKACGERNKKRGTRGAQEFCVSDEKSEEKVGRKDEEEERQA